LRKIEAKVNEGRIGIDTHRATNYGFASLGAVPYAHIVAQQLRGKHPRGVTVELAPNPRDIVSSTATISLS
jgi:hypothetical protein